MLKKFMGAVVLVLVGSIALADTIRGIVSKVDDKGTITITPFKKGEKGEEKTIKTDAKTTYAKILGKDKFEDIEKDGAKVFKEAVEKAKKGVFATVEEEKGTATKISFFAGKKKTKPKDKDLE